MFDADFKIADRDLPKLTSLMDRPKAEAYRFRIRNYSNHIPLFHPWKPCRGEYPVEEKFSRCCGYYDRKKTVLFQNRPDIRCRARIHDIVDHSVHENGLRILDTDILIHHFEFFKGMSHHIKKHAYYLKLEKREAKEWSYHKRHYFNIVSDFILTNEDPSKARQWAAQLLTLDTRDSQSWCLRAMIEMQDHQLNLAEKYLYKSFSLQPLFSNLCLLGWLYLRKGDFEKSRLFLKKALKKQPDNPLVINLLGVLKERSGRYREALLLFQKASRIHPGYADAVFNQAVIHEKKGRSKESRRLYYQAKRLATIESR